MANTIGGANLTAIAEMSIEPLMSAFLPLRAFTTDFSSDVAQRGAAVTTRYATVPTAQDLTSGYVRTDATTTAITVTLDTFYGFVWGYADDERSKSSISLNDTLINPAANALGTKVFGDVWNLVNDTNYPVGADTGLTATQLIVTSANFDRDDVADLAGQMTTNKSPKIGRSLILNPTYYASLAKDLNAADSAGQTVTIGEHRIPRLHGFDVYESDACDGNSVNVTGLACHRTNILVAGRQVDYERAQAAGVEVVSITLPDLELPVQFRRWYDPETGYLKYSVGLLYGVKFGLPTNGIKIVSA